MSNTSSNRMAAIPCVILSGGQSRRFGSNKAFAVWRGERLVDHLIGRLRLQTRGPIAINTPQQDADQFQPYPVIGDRMGGAVGPLAGLHAALCWAEEQGFDQVITTPVDTPLLPLDFVARLVASGTPSIASSGGKAHPVHGLWATLSRPELEREIDCGMRAATAWADAVSAAHCEFGFGSDCDPFFNVNTPEDLIALDWF